MHCECVFALRTIGILL